MSATENAKEVDRTFSLAPDQGKTSVAFSSATCKAFSFNQNADVRHTSRAQDPIIKTKAIVDENDRSLWKTPAPTVSSSNPASGSAPAKSTPSTSILSSAGSMSNSNSFGIHRIYAHDFEPDDEAYLISEHSGSNYSYETDSTVDENEKVILDTGVEELYSIRTEIVKNTPSTDKAVRSLIHFYPVRH